MTFVTVGCRAIGPTHDYATRTQQNIKYIPGVSIAIAKDAKFPIRNLPIRKRYTYVLKTTRFCIRAPYYTTICIWIMYRPRFRMLSYREFDVSTSYKPPPHNSSCRGHVPDPGSNICVLSLCACTYKYIAMDKSNTLPPPPYPTPVFRPSVRV